MKMLSVQEFALLAGISRQYTWQLIKMRRIKSRKIGKYFVIPEMEIIKYLKLSSANKANNKISRTLINNSNSLIKRNQ